MSDRGQKDSRRLDWLGRQYLAALSMCLCVDEPHDGEIKITRETDTGWESHYGKTLRDAIDAAASIATQAGKGME